jgi:hypothetical protein
MKSLFILFIAALAIVPASAQNLLRFETLNSDKAILAYVTAFSESSSQSTCITYNLKNILEINKSPILDSSDSHFLFSFTTFGLRSIEAGMYSTTETEDPKIGEDTIGLPQDKIEKLKQFATSKGLRFSEQWFSVSKPKGHIIGSSKSFKEVKAKPNQTGAGNLAPLDTRPWTLESERYYLPETRSTQR